MWGCLPRWPFFENLIAARRFYCGKRVNAHDAVRWRRVGLAFWCRPMLTDRHDNALTTGSARRATPMWPASICCYQPTKAPNKLFSGRSRLTKGLPWPRWSCPRASNLRAWRRSARSHRPGPRACSHAPARERSHIAALGRLIDGDGAGALAAAQEHLREYPRDAMVLAPCLARSG